jgi:hypothetical protein
MVDGSSIPASPEAISPAWLSARLGHPVSTIRVEPVIEGSGVNGEMYRLYLGGPGSGSDLPPSIMAKFPSHRPAARGVARYQRWYEREVRFYLELAQATPMRTPRCLEAAITPDDDFILLLEDLGAFPQGNQVAGCSVRQAERAVEAAAALHARWWEPEPAPHAWLPFTTVGLDRAGPVSGAFARAWSVVRDAFPERARSALDRGVEAYPELLAEVSRGPVTLCHGDYRLDNVFFDPTQDDEVIAFDWQFACRARGTYDIAYFLALDLEPAVLAEHRDALFERYIATLSERGVEGYTYVACRHDYAVSLVLATAVFAIGAAGEQPTDASRLTHEVGLRRLGEAVAAAVDEGLL